MKFFTIVKSESERLPGKNWALLGGKPLWRHTVDRFSGHQVFVNTDSEELLQSPPLDLPDSVHLYRRSEKHVTWESSSARFGSPVNSMLEEFYDRFVDDEDEPVVLFHVTSPFVGLETVLKAAKYLEKYKSVHSIQKVADFAWLESNTEYEPINFEEHLVQRTQDLNPILLSRGAFFITTKRGFNETKSRDARPRFFVDIGPIEGLEIDTADDFKLAKLVARGMGSNEAD